MEFDLWNEDDQLTQKMGMVIDIPVETTGQFGDIKTISCQGGNNVSRMQLSPDMLSEYEEETVGSGGVEWMESGNVGSILETLVLVEDLSPAFSNAHDTDVFVSQYEEQPDTVLLSSPNSPHEEVIVTDSELSPPFTPENEQHVIIHTFDLDSISQSSFSEDFEDLNFSKLDISNLVECAEGSVEPEINFLSTVDDVEGTRSYSGPTPSKDVNRGVNIIQSSPELFKIITTTPFQKQFPPYPETSKQSSKSPKAKPVQLSLYNKQGDSSKSAKSKPVKLSKFQKQLFPYPETSMQTSKSPKSKPVKPSKRKAAKKIPENIIWQQLDKKERKKLQNKNAAIRYREKKKEEAEHEKSEVTQIENVNTELKRKVADIQREIRYRKTLMGDMGIIV